MGQKRFQPLLFVWLIAALAFYPVLGGAFVWDELIYLENQRSQPHGQTALDAFAVESDQNTWIFRPITTIVMRAAYGLAAIIVPEETPPADPRRAWPPHLFSLGLHLAAIGMLMLFAARCLRGRAGAAFGTFAAGLVFALHPIHVENVAWSAATADTLATSFVLGSLVAFSKGREKGSALAYGLAASLFALAVFSKEVVVPCIVVYATWEFFFAQDRKSSRTMKHSAVLAAVTIFAVGYFWLRSGRGFTVIEYSHPDPGLAFKQILSAIGFYTRKIWFPWPLTPMIPRFPGLAQTLAWVAIGAALSGWALYASKRGDRLYLFCVLWFYLTCIPSLYIALRGLECIVLAERFLYLPSVGFAVALGALAGRLWESRARNVMLATLGALVVVYGVTSWKGTWLWHTEKNLMTAITQQEQSKNQILGWANLGVAHIASGRLDEAERCFRKALSPGMDGLRYQRDKTRAFLAYVLFYECAANRGLADRQDLTRNQVSREEAEKEFRIASAADSEDRSRLNVLNYAQLYRSLCE